MPRYTCDTSVLVPALASWHEHHRAAEAAIARCSAVPGHVLMETLSVLTRLPSPHRVEGAVVVDALRRLPLPVITLSPESHLEVLQRLTAHAIRGGSVYDGLVAATAAEHGCLLYTRDRRARRAYDAVGVELAALPE